MSVVKAVIWPALLLIFRKQIVGLLGRLVRATAGGVSLEFKETVDDARAQLQEFRVLQNSQKPADRTSDFRQDFQFQDNLYLESSYVGLVVRAWSGVQKVAKTLQEQMFPESYSKHSADNTRVANVVRELYKRGLVSAQVLNVVRNLQSLRNQMVHDQEKIGVSAADSLLVAIKDLEIILKTISDDLAQLRKNQ